MPINLACHGCGKPFSVPDHFAGRRGKCKHCGTAMDVPVFAPSPPLVVDQDVPVRLMARRRRRSGQLPSVMGVIVFVAWAIFAASIWRYAASQGRPITFVEAVLRAGLSLAILLAVLSLLLGPLVIPAVLARRGVLSTGRWLILAAFCVVAAVMLCGIWYLVDTRGGTTYGGDYPILAAILSPILWGLLLGLPGYLLAAAIHKPQPPL